MTTGCGRPYNGGKAIIDGMIPEIDTIESQITASTSTVKAGQSILVSIKAVNQIGDPLVAESEDWIFGVSGGTSFGTFKFLSCDAEGNHIIEFTGISAGTPSQIFSTFNGKSLMGPQIEVINSDLSLEKSEITVSSSMVAVGNSITVTLTAKDTIGNSFSSGGLSVVFSHSGGSSTGTFSAVTDHNDGTYTATFTGVSAGTPTTLHATINGSAVTSSPPSVTVTESASLSQSLLTVSAPTVASGSNITVTLTAKNSSGNQLPSGGLLVAFSHSGGTSTGTFSSVTDHGNGTYTATFTGVTVGTATTVQATINGSLVTSTLPTVTVTPGSASLSQSQVTVSASTVVSGSTITATLTAKDSNGNQHSSGGLTVAFSHFGGTSTGTFSSVTDHGNGTYTATFTGVTAGTATTIQATINGSLVTSALPTVTVIPGSLSLSQSQVTVSAATVASGSTITATLTAKDSNENQLPSGGLTVAFSHTGGTSTGTFSSVTDHGNGTYTATFTGVTVGTATTIQATINGSLVTSALPTVTVTPGSFSLSQSLVTVSAATVASGSTITATLTVKDSNGNQHSSGGLTVAFSHTGGTSTGTFSSVTDHGNGTYTAIFTGVIAGTATTIRATINGSLVTSALPTVTVTVGPASAAQSTITLSSSTVLFGSTITATLTAKDSNGNFLTSGGLTVVFSHTGGTSTGTFGSVTDQANGTYTVVFTGVTPGSATSIRATINGTLLTSVLPTVTVTGVNLEVPVEMIDSGIGSLTSATTYDTSRTNLTTTDYDGYPSVSYSFEVIAANSDSTNKSITIIDSSDVQLGTITAIAGTGATRYRASFTPNSGLDNYRVRLQATTSSGQLSVYTARILILQPNATKTNVYFPLMAAPYTTASTTVPNPIDSTGSIFYTQTTAAEYQIYRKNEANFATIAAGSPWTFEAVLWTSGGTCSASLFDLSSNQISSSEISSTSTSPVLLSRVFANNTSNFNDLTSFQVQIKSTLLTLCNISKAGLWLKLSQLSKGEVYYRLEKRYNNLASSSVTANSRVLIDQTNFSGKTLTFYYETSGLANLGSTFTVRAGTHGSNDTGTSSPSAVTGCSITSAQLGLSRTWFRSSACSGLTSGDRYINELVLTGGSISTASHLIVLNFQ